LPTLTPDAGVVGCQQVDGEGELVTASLVTGSVQCHPITPKHCGPYYSAWVSGACMLLRRQACEEVGWLDEGLVFGYDDMELCWRMQKAGWGVYFLPDTRVIHHQEGSTGHGFNPYVYKHSLVGLARVTRKYYWAPLCFFIPGWIAAGVVLQAGFHLLKGDYDRMPVYLETIRGCIDALW
jgi:GT2 family glycosyltransferase